MNFIIVGTNHKYCPIALRERLSFSKKRLKDAYLFLKDNTGIKNAVIISTCNRVEIYAMCDNGLCGLSGLEEFLCRYHEINRSRLAPYLYRYSGKEAIRHIFEVASGLDSQVLGESQILDQVKFFHGEARRFASLDSVLDKIFDRTEDTSETVHRETNLSCGDISIASIAMALIKKEVEKLDEKRILVVGVGKVAELLTRYLSRENVFALFVSSRRYEKALMLAESIGAKAVRFEKWKENLNKQDIIISATASPHMVLKKEDLIGIKKPFLIIDLALPRDVDPEIRNLEGVKLFDLDDLNSIEGEGIAARKLEAKRAHEIIDEEVNRICEESIKSEPEEARLP